MKANVEKKGERNPFSEEKQTRFAKMEGISLKGDFEQRRSGWSTAENKAACFECGNTDSLKAQFPIWKEKKAKWAGEGLTSKRKRKRGERTRGR